MVNLLKNQTIRLISAILSFFAISSIVAHSFVFIILYANTQEEPLGTIPFSLIGQGLWCGGTAIVSSATLFAFVNAREKLNYDAFCMRGEKFACKMVTLVVLVNFMLSLIGVLVDGFGAFLLASSEWFGTVGGTALFCMLLVELASLLGINLICFICLAFTARKIDMKRDHRFEKPRSRFVDSRNERRLWHDFYSASDLYRVKAVNYKNRNISDFDLPVNSTGSTMKKAKSSGYNSESSTHSKTILSIPSSENLDFEIRQHAARLQ